MPPKKKSVGRPPKNSVNEDVKTYRCTMCGKEETDPNKKFYKVPYSKTHEGNDKYAHICIECVKEEFERYKKKFTEEKATQIICAMLDVPYYRSLYESVARAQDQFAFGYYIRQINGKQYAGHSFALTLANGEFERTKKEVAEEAEELAESNWTTDEKRAKNEVVRMLGYDPFDGYTTRFRRKLFLELSSYLDDDELLSDNYKMAQIIQIINNNFQINQYDIAISKLDAARDTADITDLNRLKKELVVSNEKIAKENGISVKSRGDQRAGKGTLTGLMRDMRDKKLKDIEVNFYDQLQSENSRWATDISMRSMMENCAFDENDVNDIIEHQRTLLNNLQNESDDLKEERRLWKADEILLKARISKLEKFYVESGGDLSLLDEDGDQ